MDHVDRKICDHLQRDGRASSSDIAAAAGVPTSTAHDRVRRLTASGVISGWRAVLDPDRVGAGLACFVLIDMHYTGEEEAVAALAAQAEVQELHHISGAHSYLAKLRVPDMAAMQRFLSEVVKPLAAVARTETIFALHSIKETSEVCVADFEEGTPL